MSFNNPQLPLDSLPAAQDLELESLSPRYRWEAALQSLLGFVIPAAVLIGLSQINDGFQVFGDHEAWGIAVLITIALLTAFMSILSASKKKLALREHDIAYQKGLIWRRTVVLPVTRIQHVELSTGPLERMFNHVTLKFFTAGGSQVDLKIPGLDPKRASRLRQWLLQRLGQEAVSGLEQTTSDSELD